VENSQVRLILQVYHQHRRKHTPSESSDEKRRKANNINTQKIPHSHQYPSHYGDIDVISWSHSVSFLLSGRM
ncbi:hypothetical protein J0S82_019512, partial [Galemys pyrenaicus]